MFAGFFAFHIALAAKLCKSYLSLLRISPGQNQFFECSKTDNNFTYSTAGY
jgi:hypothetical protein